MFLDRFRTYTPWNHVANRQAHEAPADPWRLVRVDPGRVTAHVQAVDLRWGLGRVQGGDWDREPEPITETTVYRGLRQRFEDERPWEDTAIYRAAEERFDGGDSYRGYEDLAAFRAERLPYVDDLYRSIRQDGYRPNAEADHDPAADNRFEAAWAHHLEPLMVVGRDGELFLTEGFHRFCIASLLDLDDVPVQVLCRHEDWQRVRDRVDDGGDLPDGVDRSHPDLRDVTGSD